MTVLRAELWVTLRLARLCMRLRWYGRAFALVRHADGLERLL